MIGKHTTVFITGASSGIGLACAETFATAGARLILCARRIDVLQEHAERLSQTTGVSILPLHLDVRNRDDVISTIGNLAPEWGDIDILVNNAGLARGLGKLHLSDMDDWEEMLDTNVKGLLYVTRAIVPGMVHRRKGHIINIGSIAGLDPYPGGAVYNGSKFAVDGITRALRMDLVDTPLRVTSVDPGLVETDFSMVRFRGDSERARSVYAEIEALQAGDVAEAVFFAASRPAHVSVNQIVIMPTAQASSLVKHLGPLR
ncbi:MAG: SDR family NAD(P)-dependent oxidoreductase [Bacteroidia bacterium]|nr:SDR family NAD(P)-dependent oxidoreductase [Bacteroidia bacterium]